MANMRGLERLLRRVDTRMLKDFLVIRGVAFDGLDWWMCPDHRVDDAFAQELLGEFLRMRARNWDLYIQMCSELIDISVLAEGWRHQHAELVRDPHSHFWRIARKRLQYGDEIQHWREELEGLGLRTPEEVAMWIWDRDPLLFDELLDRKLWSMCRHSRIGYWYDLPAGGGPVHAPGAKCFEAHVKECLERELDMDLRVRVDVHAFKRIVRYVVNVDTVPDRHAPGEWDTSLPILYITHPTKGYVRFNIRDYRLDNGMKFAKGVRDEIAKHFVQDLFAPPSKPKQLELSLAPARAESTKPKQSELEPARKPPQAAKAKPKSRRGGTRKYSDKDEQAIIDFVEKPEYELDRTREGSRCYNITKAAVDWGRQKHKKNLPKNQADFRKAYENIKRRRRSSKR